MTRRLVAFVTAAAVMVVFGSAAHSFFVQRAWSQAAGLAAATAPVPIPLDDRVGWTMHDLVGMFIPYAAATALALLIGFFVAGLLSRYTGFRTLIFGIAGAVAIFAMFTAMRMLLGTVGIFGARGPIGLAAQMGVGLCAGMLFARLSRRS
jgi:hypothetical protein